MRIQGPFHTHLPLAPKRRKRGPAAIDGGQEQSPSSSKAVVRYDPDVDYIAADDHLEFDERELSADARRALKGYWAVANQSRLWAEWQRIDIYV